MLDLRWNWPNDDTGGGFENIGKVEWRFVILPIINSDSLRESCDTCHDEVQSDD